MLSSIKLIKSARRLRSQKKIIMSESKKPREWTLKWDCDFQYTDGVTDGVSVDILVASGSELDENEKIKVIEKEAYDKVIEALKEARNDLWTISCATRFDDRIQAANADAAKKA